MILKEENWNILRKNYIVCGRRSNEYVAIVEWFWKMKTEMFGEKWCKLWVVEELMCM